MRTVAQEKARFSWLSTAEFAAEIGGVGEDQVRALIKSGWFRRDPRAPECLNVARPGAKRPEWRFHRRAVERFWRERAA